MQFKSLLLLASVVSLAYGATFQDVLTDLTNLELSLTTLNDAVEAFANPGGTFAQALTIHTQITSTKSAMDKATNDANAVSPNPFSESDTTAIIGALDGVLALISDPMTQIVAKKAAFESLPVEGFPAVVRQDLILLENSTTLLGDALFSAAPSDDKRAMNLITTEIEDTVATALAAYLNG